MRGMTFSKPAKLPSFYKAVTDSMTFTKHGSRVTRGKSQHVVTIQPIGLVGRAEVEA